jgi:hypothetical protein
MIDRFNFYDIYGFVLPGTLLAGIFWLPLGLATNSLPASEISSTLLLLVLAYIAGHLLQTVAQVVVSSRVRDPQKNLRERSSLILDTGNHVFSPAFKENLGTQITAAFNVQIIGDDEKSIANRASAFFQARAYLLQNKSTGYVEQFEGLYVMMRGFACAFFVGCAYLTGWGLSFHWPVNGMGEAVWIVMVVSIGGALIATASTVYFEAQVPPADKAQRDMLDAKKRTSYRTVSVFLLFFVAALGYFLGTWKMATVKPFPAQIEFFLWAALPIALIAGIRCLHAYGGYAENFAETVWRDFSASYKPDPPTPSEGAHTHDAGGGGVHVHPAAPKLAPAHGHDGGHGDKQHGHV